MVTTVFAVRATTADNGSADLLLFADRESAERYAKTFKGLLGFDSVDIVERRVFGVWDTNESKRSRATKSRTARARRHAVSAKH